MTANIYFYDDSPGIFETFWTKNDKKINPEESGKVLSEMTTHNPSLTIRNVGPDDAGEYQLSAINDVGSSTSDVIILGIIDIKYYFLLTFKNNVLNNKTAILN